MESKTIWICFPFSYFINIYCIPCTLNGSFTDTCIFINIKHWSFGKHSFIGLYKISKFYHISLNNITFVSKGTYFTRKAFMNWEIDKFIGADKSFPKLWFLFESSDVGTRYSWICFPWSDKLTLFLLKKISAKYSSLKIQFACQLFFQVKMVIHEKSG